MNPTRHKPSFLSLKKLRPSKCYQVGACRIAKPRGLEGTDEAVCRGSGSRVKPFQRHSNVNGRDGRFALADRSEMSLPRRHFARHSHNRGMRRRQAGAGEAAGLGGEAKQRGRRGDGGCARPVARQHPEARPCAAQPEGASVAMSLTCPAGPLARVSPRLSSSGEIGARERAQEASLNVWKHS